MSSPFALLYAAFTPLTSRAKSGERVMDQSGKLGLGGRVSRKETGAS